MLWVLMVLALVLVFAGVLCGGGGRVDVPGPGDHFGFGSDSFLFPIFSPSRGGNEVGDVEDGSRM